VINSTGTDITHTKSNSDTISSQKTVHYNKRERERERDMNKKEKFETNIF